MKQILKLEEFAMFALSIYAFSLLDFAWWWYLALFFVPDISFIGYAISNKVGAVLYNIFHHKGIAILIFIVGLSLMNAPLQLVGLVLFGHASFDRILGYGLKYETSFNHTHLGIIGKEK